MQLDRTRIVIRERSSTELLDLSLRVLGRYGKPIALTSAILIVPFAILNELLIAHLIADELSALTIPQYVSVMAQLVFIEAPFATTVTTVFLGRMMFLQETDLRSMVHESAALIGRLTVTQLIKRGVFVAIAIGVLSWSDPDYIHLLWIVTILVGIVRMGRPFINEIVLLEKNPLRSKDKSAITVSRRSSRLHGPSSGDLFGRSILMSLVLFTAVCSVGLSLWFIQGLMTNLWVWGHWMIRGFVPLSMWVVAVYSTVYRFLCYLDLRIRREGWEVELQVRAAAAELQGVHA
ncbi:MAG: hypothetical protein KDB27_10660 [Planctomycetales bacterium]|nr:hypothetical protein [Planctomycetales bacterium]